MAQMRVPVNPQTRPAFGELGYERPVDISAGTRALGNAVREYGEYVQQENKKKQLFDVQRELVNEANALQTDFENRKQAAPLGADGFTQSVNDAYTARHAQLSADLKARGFSADSINEFESRLGTMRGQYIAQAIDFQDKSQYTKVLGETEEMATGLSQYVNSNPNSINSGLDEFKEGLSHSGLDAQEQAAIYQHYAPQIRQSAQQGFAVKHPEVVLGLYGFPNELKQVGHEITGELVNLGDAQRTVADTFTEAGWNPNVIAGFLGNFDVEGGYTGKTGDGGSAAGIAQWRGPRRAAFKNKYGKDASAASVAENAQHVVYEMQHPEEAGMTIAQRDAILAAKSPEEAAELIDKYYERSNGKMREQRKEAAKLFTKTLSHADQTTAMLVSNPTENISVSADGKTGIAVLDSATGPERMEMLNRARVIMNERVADQKEAEREQHNTYINQLYNDLYDGRKSQSDLNSAVQQGLITDYDERSKAQNIIDAKNKKNTDFQRFTLMWNSGVKGNPYDKDQQAAVDAGFSNRLTWAAKNNEDISPFAIALRIWEKTGVLPTQGGVMIRGAMIGTDPNQVAAAASVATNMLQANPNAFAGVDGGEDIGKAAATYKYYVDELGMSAQDAANRISTANSPEFKAKVEADKPAREKFIKKLNETGNIETRLNNQFDIRTGVTGRVGRFFGGGEAPGKFVSKSQLAEANQTFVELATTHWDQYHDEGAAVDYATRQMSRFYGVENGRLLKYPATKAYPEINGSREYIFDQAKEAVDGYIKSLGGNVEIPKENIWLQPTGSGSSAAAFRAGKPVPYELHYVTESKNGQKIYHVVPGQVFVADINKARADAAVEARKEEQRVRNNKPQKGESYEQFLKRTKQKPNSDTKNLFLETLGSLFD